METRTVCHEDGPFGLWRSVLPFCDSSTSNKGENAMAGRGLAGRGETEWAYRRHEGRR
jgi:hypothetical protein